MKKPTENFKSRKEWEEYAWKQIVADFFKSKSELEIEALLDSLFASNERKRAIKRAAMASLLQRGMKYRDIGQLLWVSSATISAIKRSISDKDGYISRYERQGKKKKQIKPPTKLRIRLEAILTIPPPPLIPSNWKGLIQFGGGPIRIKPRYRKSGRRLP